MLYTMVFFFILWKLNLYGESVSSHLIWNMSFFLSLKKTMQVAYCSHLIWHIGGDSIANPDTCCLFFISFPPILMSSDWKLYDEYSCKTTFRLYCGNCSNIQNIERRRGWTLPEGLTDEFLNQDLSCWNL